VFQRSKRQTARARVNVRLADPVTSHVFFAADGTGEASTEVYTTLGFGGQAAFDSTLDDKAWLAWCHRREEKLAPYRKSRFEMSP